MKTEMVGKDVKKQLQKPEKELDGEEGDADGLHHPKTRVVHRLPVDVFHLLEALISDYQDRHDHHGHYDYRDHPEYQSS